MSLRPLRAVGFLVLFWAVAAGVLVVFAALDLRAGIDEVDAARDALAPGDLATPEPAARLGRARVRFARADARISNPLLAPARFVPVAGRQLRTVTALARTAHTVAEAGQRAAIDVAAALDAGSTAGPDRLRMLDRMSVVLQRAQGHLEGLDLGPSDALIGPVRKRRARFAEELGEAREGLADAQLGVAALRDLLGGNGPRRYLVLAGNNAEMRAGSAAFLSVGVLQSTEGRIALGEFEPAGDLTLPPPAPPMEADLAARWGWAEPNREWRNLGLSPRFDASGALAAAMWEARTGERVDGVVALDVAAVKAIVATTGPIHVDGERIDADEVAALLMHDQYVEGGATLGGAQTDRRERLGSLASTAVAEVEDGRVDPAELASHLADAGAGRHVLLWAADPEAQAGWAAAGVGGEVRADGLLVGLINRGANKLDPFLAVESTFSTSTVAGATRVALRVVVENRTPAGEIAYIAGPNPQTSTGYGEYRGILAVTAPGAARALQIGDLPLVAAGPDGPSRVAAAEIRIAAGDRQVVEVSFSLPGTKGALQLLPSARLLPIEWRRAGTEPFNDGLGRTLSW